MAKLKAEQFEAICIVNSEGEEVTAISNISRICGVSYLAPDLADAIELEADAAEWGDDGTAVEIIAADSIDSDYFIDFIDVSDISETAEIQINLYADEVFIGSISTTDATEGRIPIVTKKQLASSAITALLCSSTSNATTANIKIGYSIP